MLNYYAVKLVKLRWCNQNYVLIFVSDQTSQMKRPFYSFFYSRDHNIWSMLRIVSHKYMYVFTQLYTNIRFCRSLLDVNWQPYMKPVNHFFSIFLPFLKNNFYAFFISLYLCLYSFQKEMTVYCWHCKQYLELELLVMLLWHILSAFRKTTP